MDPLSGRARELLRSLSKRWTLLGRLMRSGEVSRLLRDLSALGECAVVPYLLPLLIVGRPREISAAGEAIRSLLTNATSADLVYLDLSMRDRTVRDPEVPGVDAFEVYGLPAGLNAAGISILLKILSMHRNGYVREGAVTGLDAVDDGSEIPFLLLRMNDWVSKVRDRARHVITARLTPAFAPLFVKSLPLLARLSESRRGDHQDLLREIAELIICVPGAREALIADLAGNDRAIRRAALRIATLANAADYERFIESAATMADPVVRLFAARAAAATFRGSNRLGLFTAFAVDPSASVRAIALAALAANFPDDARPFLEVAVMDRSASVRDLARFELRKRGQNDFASTYRQALTGESPARLATAIDGLREVGERSDAAALLPFLSHPNARVRCASVRAVVQLGGETLLGNVLPSLHDPANSVASLTVRMFSRHAAVIGADEIQMRFRAPVAQHLRVNVLRLMAALPKWDSILMLLVAATDRDVDVAAAAVEQVRRWIVRYGRSFVAPSPEQVKRIRSAVANAECAIDSRLTREIVFVLDSWKDLPTRT